MESRFSIAQWWPRSTPVEWGRLVLAGAVVAIIVYAYWIAPVAYESPRMSAYEWLIGHWSNVSNYSHGPLIPMIASFLLWWNVSHRAPAETDWRPYWNAVAAGGATLGIWLVGGSIKESWDAITYRYALMLLPLPLAWQVWTLRGYLRSEERPMFGLGITTVIIAMLLYYFGVKSVQARVVICGGVLLMLGLVMTLRGRDVVRLVFFPICFLLLMVPLNFLDTAIGFPLRMFVAKAATLILNLIGIEAVQRGSGIISAVFRFDVADPCSGIRSLMALTTVTAAYAYVTQQSQWKRWFLFLCALPLAVFGNLARVISIAVVAQVYGQDLATKIYHDWSGFILFPVALGAMVLVGFMLNFDFRQFARHLTQPPATTSHNEQPSS